MEADGGSLVVRTDRYAVEFLGGEMTRVRIEVGGATFTPVGDPTKPSGQEQEETADVVGPGFGLWDVQGNVATYTKEWAGGTFTMRVAVDPESGDLVVSQTRAAAEKNVRSVSWHVQGLSLADGNVILPSSGGISVDKGALFREVRMTYPFAWPDWSSQLMIYQGEGVGFSIWSTDRMARFKQLVMRRRGNLFDLEFHTENPAPFNERDGCRSVEWRFNVHEGDWRVPAGRYRDWMAEAFGLIPWSGEVEWAKEIRAIVKVHGRSPVPDFLATLEKHLIPERTLIYVPDWRTDGYDVNYPDYTPGDYIESFIEEAHRRGFRVMLHVNLPGISPRHPLYPEFEAFHAKDPVSLSPLGWHWHEQLPVTHAFINPASLKYRALYVSLMRELIGKTGADSLHLDVSAPIWNDGNGLIEGKNYPQGSMLLHRQLKRALPEVVLGGESISEITLRGERFYQRWEKRGVGRTHPIESFLYGEFALPVGYLGLPNPDSGPGGYMEYARDYESWGVLPTIPFDMSNTSDFSRPHTEALLAEARAWQEHLLTPQFDRPWTENEKFVWTGADGTGGVLEQFEGGSVRMRIGEEIFYERIRGATEWSSPLVIQSWPAFSGERYFGLDPQAEYEALPMERESLPLHIVDLERGSVLRTYRIDPSSALLEFESRPRGPIVNLAPHLVAGRVGTTIDGADGPLQKGARFDLQPGSEEREEDAAFESVCPWHPVGAEQDKAWGMVFLETDEFHLQGGTAGACLRFETAIAASATQGDGSTFRVSINGKEAFSEWRRDTTWKEHTVPLDEFEGGLRLRLSLDPGPNNSVSYDLGLWRNLRIERTEAAEGERATTSVTLRTVSPIDCSNVDAKLADGSSTFECPSGKPLVLFFEPVAEVTGEVSLLEVPFEFGVEGSGIYTARQSAWGSGSIMSVTAGDRTLRGISGHPPGMGRTYIRQTVKVSEDLKNPVLRFTARVNEGAVTTGVGFLVLLNGNEVWSWITRAPGYRDGEVPLSPEHVGRPLLIEWVTDSLGDPHFDWAIWADPRIEEK